MKGLMEKTREILQLWSKEHNIKEMADLSNLTYNIIRNNYFKHFWKKGYLDRTSKGRYIMNEKGKLKIIRDLNFIKSKKLILKLSKNKFSNKQIQKILKNQLNVEITDSSLFTQISRLRKVHNIKHRRIKDINIKINKDFYVFLGLILSDGYLNRYYINFCNKDSTLISYYENLINRWNQNFSKRKMNSGAYTINTYSIKLVSLVNRFLNNKRTLSKEIIKSKNLFKNSFLKGLYSGDGSVFISISYKKSKKKWRIEPRISLAVYNNKIMNPLLIILKSKSYKPICNKNYIILNRKDDIKKFYKEIRFIDGGKIHKSKYWNGFSKNQVLKYIANYINNDYTLKDLMKNPNKNTIIKHIKGRLMSV